MSAIKEYEEQSRPMTDRPMTTTRLRFPDGTIRYVLVPKGYDIQLRWARFKVAMGGADKATPDAFMIVLHEEAVVDVDVQVDVDMPLS